MPLPMVHLYVAKLLPKAKEPGAFYLGAIAPDAVHMRPDFDKQDKARSHFCAEWSRLYDPVLWEKNVLARWDALKRSDFGRGYAVHILTDIACNCSGIFRNAYKANPEREPKPSKPYYNDADLLGMRLYAEKPWRVAVWEALRAADAEGMADVLSPEETAMWRDRLLGWFDERSEADYAPRKYIRMEEIESFAQDAAARIRSLLTL